jgi:hypothetical protein
MDQNDMTTFDASAGWSIAERGLPHWSQRNCVCFVTWRLADSLPAQALHHLDAEINQVLRSQGLDPQSDWKRRLAQRDARFRGSVNGSCLPRETGFSIRAMDDVFLQIRPMRKSWSAACNTLTCSDIF